jgi:hypothetical protein
MTSAKVAEHFKLKPQLAVLNKTVGRSGKSTPRQPVHSMGDFSETLQQVGNRTHRFDDEMI